MRPPAPIRSPSRRTVLDTPHGVFMHWCEIGSFLVEAGASATIDDPSGVDRALVRPVLRKPILGVPLSQRGLRAFHAPVVADLRGDSTVAVVGRKGAPANRRWQPLSTTPDAT